MTPVLWFVHGWGFDASVFDAVAGQLQEWPQARFDAGYFGESSSNGSEAGGLSASGSCTGESDAGGSVGGKPGSVASWNATPSEPFIAVTHSFGMMRVLKDLPEHCVGVVCLNGFARFTAAPDFAAGTPARLVDRMATRLGQDPMGVVTTFRARCGATDMALPTSSGSGLQRLADDLAELRNGDARAALAACRVPIVALAAADDPIVPPAMTDRMLADRPDAVLSMLADGGHLLPVTRPDECAAAVRRLIGLLEQTRICEEASDPANAAPPDGESSTTAPAP